MTAVATAAEAMLEQIDRLLGAVDDDLNAELDSRVDAILTSAVTDAIASIRAGAPGRALFTLEAGRLRAQHLLDRSAR